MVVAMSSTVIIVKVCGKGQQLYLNLRGDDQRPIDLENQMVFESICSAAEAFIDSIDVHEVPVYTAGEFEPIAYLVR